MNQIKKTYLEFGLTVGIIIAGLPPALIFGYSLYAALQSRSWPVWAASIAAAALGISIEVVGATTADIALNATGRKRLTGAAMLSINTLAGVAYMIFVETSLSISAAGIMAYTIAPMLYIASSIQDASERDREVTFLQNRQERDELERDRQWDRKIELERAQRQAQRQAQLDKMAHELKIERARLAHERKIAVASQNGSQPIAVASQNGSQPIAVASHACDYCERSFDKPQSLSAHLRHCKKYKERAREND